LFEFSKISSFTGHFNGNSVDPCLALTDQGKPKPNHLSFRGHFANNLVMVPAAVCYRPVSHVVTG
jgi:hypothetical protein